MAPSGGIGFDFDQRNRLVTENLPRSRQPLAVDAPTAGRSRLRRIGRPIQLRIRTDASDQDRSLGNLLPDARVGETSVGQHAQASLGVAVFVELTAQPLQLFGAAPREVLAFLFEPILLLLLVGRFVGRPHGGRCVKQLDGDAARRPGRLLLRHGGGDLQEPLSPHEVDLKRRPQRVPTPADAGGAPAAAKQQGVVHRHDQIGAGVEFGHHPAAQTAEEIFHFEALLREEPIGARPVERPFSGGFEPTADGMASQAGEVA